MTPPDQRPRPCLLTLNGEDPNESLSISIIAAGCKVLAELRELNQKVCLIYLQSSLLLV